MYAQYSAFCPFFKKNTRYAGFFFLNKKMTLVFLVVVHDKIFIFLIIILWINGFFLVHFLLTEFLS